MLDDKDLKQIEDKAELQVRRYFDHYMSEVFPRQVTTLIDIHDASDKAHGGVKVRLNKIIWMATGIAAAGGASGAIAAKVVAALGGSQ